MLLSILSTASCSATALSKCPSFSCATTSRRPTSHRRNSRRSQPPTSINRVRFNCKLCSHSAPIPHSTTSISSTTTQRTSSHCQFLSKAAVKIFNDDFFSSTPSRVFRRARSQMHRLNTFATPNRSTFNSSWQAAKSTVESIRQSST